MRIALLNDDIVPSARGGSAVMVDWLRSGLVKKGHDVTLITTHQSKDDPPRKEWQDDGGRVISFFVSYPPAKAHRRCTFDPAISPLLEPLLKELRPDVVHAHVIHQYLTYDALRAARSVTPHVFLTSHDTFLVSFHRVRGERYERSVAEGKPYRMHVLEHLFSVGRKYAPLRNIKIRRILRKTSTSTIAISSALASFLSANGISIAATIPNGVPLRPQPSSMEVEAFRRRFSLTGPTILHGGRVSVDKGIYALTTAFERVLQEIPHAQLFIAADKNRADSYLQTVPEAVRKATVIGHWLSPEEMYTAYAASDVVTTPSLYLDAFNIMNIEAMALRKPVVGSCFGGIPEIIENGKTGIIVNPHDAMKFASALTTILQDTKLAQRMGEGGYNRVLDHFSIEKYIDQHLSLYVNSTKEQGR